MTGGSGIPSIDAAFARQVLAELVQANSVNPSLVPNGPGEKAIAGIVARHLIACGLEVTLDDAAPGRPNVVARLRGASPGPTLLWNGHLDTVGVAGMRAPFAATVEGGRLFGRGAQDMKGGLAAMVCAAQALVESSVQLAGDVIIGFVVDEEYASIGTSRLIETVQPDAAIVTEPTDLQLALAHRGYIWFDLETHGRAAHGSRFDEGVDANMHMGRVLASLEPLERALRARQPHPLAGPPSLHAATLQGGSALSVYAAHCRLQIERRTVPGETVAAATAELQAIVDRLTAEDRSFKAKITPFLSRDPFAVSASAPIVTTVEAAARSVLGHVPNRIGLPFWTDAALLAAAGVDTVLIGPTGHGLHGDEEWVDLASVVRLGQILAETAIRYCR